MVTRIKLNLSGFRALRKSFDDEVLERAQRIADASNADLVARGNEPGYEAEASPSKNRARATVFPNSGAALHDNADHMTLLKNLNKAR